MDTRVYLQPDGMGGVRWSTSVSGIYTDGGFIVYSTLVEGGQSYSLLTNPRNLDFAAVSGTSGWTVINSYGYGLALQIERAYRLVVNFEAYIHARSDEVWEGTLRICRKRGAAIAVLAAVSGILSEGQKSLVLRLSMLTDNEPMDLYFAEYIRTGGTSGSLIVTSWFKSDLIFSAD
jgi:hypothetical protein